MPTSLLDVSGTHIQPKPDNHIANTLSPPLTTSLSADSQNRGISHPESFSTSQKLNHMACHDLNLIIAESGQNIVNRHNMQNIQSTPVQFWVGLTGTHNSWQNMQNILSCVYSYTLQTSRVQNHGMQTCTTTDHSRSTTISNISQTTRVPKSLYPIRVIRG